MSTYFVENLTNPVPPRIDAANELNAANSFRATTGAAVGDRLRVVLDGPNFVFFFDVAPGAPVVVPATRPALPPVGS